MSFPPLQIEWVSKNTIRKIFNEKYLSRALSGELQKIVKKDKHLNPPLKHEPYCTRSQYVVFLEPDGKHIAGAHQYLRPDKTLGASGIPDPKWVIDNGQVLKYSPNKS